MQSTEDPTPARTPTAAAAVMLALVASVLLAVSAAGAAGPRFTNLRILPEDASPAEVLQVMKLMSRALGTDCRACHRTAEGEFGSDALPRKTLARAMMSLELSRRPDIDWRAPPADLCVGCHRGQLRPAAGTPGDGD